MTAAEPVIKLNTHHYTLDDPIEDVLAMVDIGSGAERQLPDVRLSR